MAETAASAARAEDGLAVVARGGYLSFHEIEEFEYTGLYLCRESRCRVPRRVVVDEDTPRTLWCRTEDQSSIDNDSSDGSDGVGDRSRRVKRDASSHTTGDAVGNNRVGSVESTGAFSDITTGLGTDGSTSSTGGSPNGSGSSYEGQYSDSPNGFNMYPMVEAMLHVGTTSTSDVINCVSSLTRGGKDGDRCQAQQQQQQQQQQRGTKLQANAGNEKESANTGKKKESARHSTITAGNSRTNNDGHERIIVCSTGEGRGANKWFAGDPPVPTAAAGPLVASRVPLARVTFIRWALPAVELTARRFLWLDGVKTIVFGDARGMFLESGAYKTTFEVLSFPECSNNLLEPGSVPLPPGLETVYFLSHWTLDLHGARENWPDSLKTLRFPSHFNQPLTGEGVGLPLGLLEIFLGETFNQPVIGVEWPPLLRKLTFSRNFNQSLEGVTFPPGLQEICMGRHFDQEIAGVVWPQGLKRLMFGISFNQALVSRGAERGAPPGRKHPLPDSLTFLDLGNSFSQPLNSNELPDGLEVLSIGSMFDSLSSVRWPPGLKKLSCACVRCFVSSTSPVVLSPRLETLRVGHRFNSPLTTIAFPPTLTCLDLGNLFNHPIGWADGDVPLLPDGLKELTLGANFNQSFENVRLPVGLKSLSTGSYSFFDQGLAGVIWPPGLEHLMLGSWFNQPMEGVTFPETLSSLQFGEAFDYSLQGVRLPDALTYLKFCGNYPAYHLEEFYWPLSLRRLDIDESRFLCREALCKWVTLHA